MTPATHGLIATQQIALHPLPDSQGVDVVELVIRAHGLLSTAMGTGHHYAAADALLTSIEQSDTRPSDDPAIATMAERAFTHALLAD